MVVGSIRILPLRDRRAEVLEILRSVQGPARAQPGCLACDIYEEQGPENAVVLVERFGSSEALEEHLRSEVYRRILGAVELSRGRPEIRFETVSASEGIELIERHRLAVTGLPAKGDKS
ncbi:MAG: Antibiotic biosynthesis monooxygenase [Acidobacteria bacterium]|nr:Antibiotic biosynthesis monooxygenase [Acidobacteriota bacterium]